MRFSIRFKTDLKQTINKKSTENKKYVKCVLKYKQDTKLLERKPNTDIKIRSQKNRLMWKWPQSPNRTPNHLRTVSQTSIFFSLINNFISNIIFLFFIFSVIVMTIILLLFLYVYSYILIFFHLFWFLSSTLSTYKLQSYSLIAEIKNNKKILSSNLFVMNKIDKK